MINFPSSPVDQQQYTTGTLTFVYNASIQSWSNQTGLLFNGGTITNALIVSNTTQSFSTTTGALQVAGGVGVGKDLYVGGAGTFRSLSNIALTVGNGSFDTGIAFDSSSFSTLRVGTGGTLWISEVGGTSFFSANATEVSVPLTTSATSTSTGALQVMGGVGIGGSVYAGNIYSNGYAVSTGSGSASLVSPYSGIFTITNTTVSTSTTTGALQVASGVGVQGTVWANSLRSLDSEIVLGVSATTPANGHGVAVGANTISALSGVAVGYGASANTGGVSIGQGAVGGTTATGAIAIGQWAGSGAQGNYAIAIGNQPGSPTYPIAQGGSSISIGNTAGLWQGIQAIAIGSYAGTDGTEKQGNYAIAIGNNAGRYTQTTGSIIISAASNAQAITTATNAGLYIYPVRADATSSATVWSVYYNPATKELTTASIGSVASLSITGTTASTSTTTGALQVAGGVGVGGNVYVGGTVTATILRTLSNNIQLGAASSASGLAIAIGNGAIATGLNGTAVGFGAQAPSSYATALGNGASSLGSSSIAVGNNANTNGGGGIAIGNNTAAGAPSAVSIGDQIGGNGQGAGSVAVGAQIAFNGPQGAYATALGYKAGYTSQTTGSIIINAGATTYVDSAPNVGLYISPIRADATTSATTYGIYYNAVTNELTTSSEAANALVTIAEVTKDIHGVVDRTASTLSFDNASKTFTITPVSGSWTYYYRGVLHTVTTATSIVIANTSGARFIRMDPATETLIEGSSVPDFINDVIVAYVYFDAGAGKALILGDERHGSQRDTTWHSAQHLNVGTVWRSGGALTYTLNSTATIEIGVGSPLVIADEDLVHNITNSATPNGFYQQVLTGAASLEVLYLSSSTYVSTTATTTPWIAGTSLASYNLITGGLGSLVDASEGDYFTYWLLATNDVRSPVKLVLGRETFSTIDAAYGESFTDYGLSFAEQVFMYQIVVQTSASYTNTPKIQIVAVRKITTKLSTSGAAASASSHNGLTGRDALDTHPIGAITDLQSTLDSKQATLVSNSNIKTVNGTTILGAGNVQVGEYGVVTTATTFQSAVSITSTTTSDATNTGALVVAGGVGVGGSINVASTSYIFGSKILTAVDLETVSTTATFITNDPTSQVGLAALAGTSTVYGTYNFGDVNAVSTFNDYNTGTNAGFYSINDATGAPGYIVYIGWTNVTTFTTLVLNVNYTASSGHTVQVDLYNFQTSGWDSFTTYSGSPGWTQFILETFDAVPYISSGKVYSRLNHTSSGNTAHRTWIDYAVLQDSLQGGQGPRGATGATGATGAQGLTTSTTSTFIFFNTSATNSTDTGAVTVAGGVGVAGSVYVGGVVTATTFIGALTGTATTATSAGTAYALATTATTYVGRAVLADSATTATNAAVAYSTVAVLTAGTGLSGSTFNGSTDQTWTLNTTTLMTTAVNQAGGSVSATTGVFSGITTVTNTTAASSTNTGALQVAGSVGVGRGLYVGGVSTFTGSVNFTFGGGAGSIDAIGSVKLGSQTIGNIASFGNSTNFGLIHGANSTMSLYTYSTNTDIVLSVNQNRASGVKVLGATGDVIVQNTTPSTTTATGALTVAGGVGIGGSMFVGGIVTATNMFIGPWAVSTGTTGGSFTGGTVTDVTTFTNTLTVADIVIGNRIFAGGTTGTNGQVLVATGSGIQWTSLGSTFNGGTITNPLIINNATASTSTTTGALQVAGGVGIGGNLYVGGTVTATVLRTLSQEISLGKSAGALQSTGSVAVGMFAGFVSQGWGAVAIGDSAGGTQSQAAISIGQGSGGGSNGQGQYAVAIGAQCGNNQGPYSIALGYNAGNNRQSTGSIIISATSTDWINISTNQGLYITPIRPDATTSATTYGVYYNPVSKELTTASVFNGGTITSPLIVNNAAASTSTITGALQVTGGVGVGGNLWATQLRQTSDKIAIGGSAGTTSQGVGGIAIGDNAGKTSQLTSAVAIGTFAGNTSQGTAAVSVGSAAGATTQGASAIAIGNAAGNNKQGPYAIAIGDSAGNTSQHTGSIVISALGTALNTVNTGTFIAPIRPDATTSATTYGVYYNAVTKELTTSTVSGGTAPKFFTFGGTGTPATGTALTPYVRVMTATTCIDASLVTKTAPTGNFTVSILRSADSGATFPTTVATITVTSGNRVGTVITTTSLAAGDLLRLDISAVNGAADWTAQLYTA